MPTLRSTVVLALFTTVGGSLRAQTADENEDTTKLDAGLAAVSAKSISTDIYKISSDEFGGRDTPSQGQRLAAAYLIERLEEIGIPPGYKDGYEYPYELLHSGLIPEKSKLRFEDGGSPIQLKFGEDYTLFAPNLQSSDAKGRIVWCGSGSKDEFKKANCKGRWAMIKFTPTATGRNLNRDLASMRQKAESEGAIGLIIVPTPGTDAGSFAKRLKGTSERLLAGHVRYPGGRSGRRRSRSSSGFATVLLNPAAATKVLAMAGSQDDSFFPVGKKIDVTATSDHEFKPEGATVDVTNVVGFWEGADSKLKREVIIVSAHYDHVGYRDDGEIHNGADDNGSGTCGLLALAGALKAYGQMQRSVLLIWVSGEDKGLYGSKAWSENPWLPKNCRPIANLNIDMIGRNEPKKLLITPAKDGRFSEQYNGVVRMAEEFCHLEGFDELGNADMYYNRSDQANFAKLGIPVAFLFSDVHEDYHKVSDEPGKIDCDKIHRTVRLVLRVLNGLQEKKLKL